MPHGDRVLHPNCYVCNASVSADGAPDVSEHAFARGPTQAAANPHIIPISSVAVGAAGAAGATGVAVAVGVAAGAAVAVGGAIIFVVDWHSLQGFC